MKRYWVIRASQPGVPASEAREQPLLTVYRSRWLWMVKIIHWFYIRYGSRSILVVEQDAKRDFLQEGTQRYQEFKQRLYQEQGKEE